MKQRLSETFFDDSLPISVLPSSPLNIPDFDIAGFFGPSCVPVPDPNRPDDAAAGRGEVARIF